MDSACRCVPLGTYTTGSGTLTAKLYYSLRSWVVLFEADAPIACYALEESSDLNAEAGYTISCFQAPTARAAGAAAVFFDNHARTLTGIGDAVALIEAMRAADALPMRGNTVTVALDAQQSCGPFADFLLTRCGFSAAPTTARPLLARRVYPRGIS